MKPNVTLGNSEGDVSKTLQNQEIPDFPALLAEFAGTKRLEVVAVDLNRSLGCVRYWLNGHSCPYPTDAEDLARRMKRSVKLLHASIVQTRAKRKDAP